MSQACTADVCTRFSLLIKAFVACRDEVSVISTVTASGVPVVQVWTAQQDRKRLLGRDLEVAQSLRTLLDCIGEQQGVEYVLDIHGVRFEPGLTRAQQSSPAGNVPGFWVGANTLPAY